jgi:hypothetical protein
MQLAPETVVAVEFAVPALIAAVLAIGHTLKKRIIKSMIFALAVTHIVLVSFRPDGYNSDTWNYSGYLEALTDAQGMEFLLLTKFEPLHLALAAVAQDFRLWLVLEGLVAIGLLAAIIRRAQRLETIAIVVGLSLPLMSSSVRFAISLMAAAYVLLVFRQSRAKFVALTAAGGFTHISLFITGVLEKRKWWLTWGLLTAFFFVAYVISSILERAGVGDEAKPTGMRTFACLLCLLMYLRWVLPEYRRVGFTSDILSGFAIFLMSFLFFPVVNRWIILLLLIVAVEADAPLDRAHIPRRLGRLVALLIYGALVVPFLYSVGSQVASGEWFVMLQASGHPGFVTV